MPAERSSERRTRRGIFHLWVGITIALALVLALILPFIRGERLAFLAGVPVVIIDFILLALGLGWLAGYVFLPKRGEGSSSDRDKS